MKKIAYIEIDTHSEIALNFSELMKDTKGFSVDYYFSKKIADLLQIKQNKYIVNPNNILAKLQNKTYDLVIIGTAHRYFKIFKQIENQYNTAIIIHNLNFSKASKWQIFKNIFKENFKFRLKLLFKESLLLSKEIYENANHILVLDKNFKNTKFTYFPLFYYENHNTEKQKNKKINIVIAGAVSQKRRDYQRVLEKIQNFKTEINIIFCGKASGKELEWLKETEKKLPQNIKIQYFTEKLNSELFSEILASADILWCPIQPKTQFMSVPEFYGKTKMSGNIGDAIKYGKPAIFPKNYASDLDFIFLEKENIEEQFYEILEQKISFENFQKEQILLELENTLKTLIK